MDSEICFHDLPSWLTKGLNNDLNTTQWMPIQKRFIPVILSNPHSDYLVNAPTGSGKTLAYALPIITLLASRHLLTTKALVVLPTRDLVDQVYQVFTKLLSFQKKYHIQDFKSPFLTVEKLEEMKKYLKHYKSHNNSCYQQPDIIISTPGHLVDSINSHKFAMPYLEYLVLDEVDELLAIDDKDPFLKSLFYSIETLHKKPLLNLQNKNLSISLSDTIKLSKLCFSATKTSNPERLAILNMLSPVTISTQEYESELIKYVVPLSLTEYYLIVSKSRKISTIMYLIQKYSLKNGLIFTASLDNTEYVYKDLKEELSKHPGISIQIDSLSGRKSDKDRRKILNSLNQSIKDQKVHFVVCTDANSRGIDIPSMDCVISFDIPIDIKSYIHRSGRTARAQMNGSVFTLVTPRQSKDFDDMIRKIQRRDKVKKINC